jgi:hypothetical protein
VFIKGFIMFPTIAMIVLILTMTLECNPDTIGGGGRSKNSHVLSLRHCSWRGTKCDLVDEVWVFVTKK